MARGQSLGRVRVDRVVSVHGDFRAELSEQVREVVRERVVDVDQEDHDSARSIAASTAANLRRHSSCSAAGSESATIPAPAWRYAIPSRSTIVLMAMHVSRSPPGRAYPTAPAYVPRRYPSRSETICIARTFGAPETV